MPEKFILFSTPMVIANLEDRKNMTRRVAKHYGRTPEQCGRDKFYKLVDELNGKQGLYAGFYRDSDVFMYEGKQHTDAVYFKAGYQPGDILYVKETWRAVIANIARFEIPIEYRADSSRQWARFTPDRFAKFRKYASKSGWQSPYFMPREAARLFLLVKDVRVERLQDISEEDARAEGLACLTKDGGITYKYGIPDSDGLPGNDDHGWHWKDWDVDPLKAFRRLWDSINIKKYPWESNPFVWAITYERTERPVTP